MKNVSFDHSSASAFVGAHEIDGMRGIAVHAAERLKSRQGEGSDFLGWIDLPVSYDKEEFVLASKNHVRNTACGPGIIRSQQFRIGDNNGNRQKHD